MSRRSVLVSGIVFSALVIRIGFVVFLSPYMDSTYSLSVDASSYHQIAQNLVERHIFTSSHDPPYNLQLPGTFRPPLTPFCLAAIYSILGVNVLWGRIGLAVMSALSCGLIYVFGEKLCGQTTGIIAGVISLVAAVLTWIVDWPNTDCWEIVAYSIGISLTVIMLLLVIRGLFVVIRTD